MTLKVNQKVLFFILFFILGTLVYYFFNSNIIAFFFFFVGVLYGLYLSCVNNVYAIWIILIMAQDWWGVVPMLNIGGGTLHWSEVNVIFAVIFFLKCLKGIKAYKLGIAYVMLYVFVGIALVRSSQLYNQSYILTLLSGRFLFTSIAFWPLVYCINCSQESRKQFLKILTKFAEITMCIYLVVYLLENLGYHVTFLQTGYRIGIRIYIDPVIIVLYCFYHLCQLIYNNREKSWINFGMGLLVIGLVSQSRATVISAVVTTVIMILTANRIRKAICYSCISLLLVIVMVGLIPQLRTIILDTLYEYIDKSDNIGVREVERMYYDEKLKGNELFGVGIPNNHTNNAVLYSGKYIDFEQQKYNNYYLEDLGIYQIKYQFGIIAYFLFYILLFYGFLRSYKYRKISIYAFVGCSFFLYMLLIGNIICYLSRSFGLVIAMAFIETVIHEGYVN